MEAGTIWINKHSELDPTIPFGGSNQSGLGKELMRRGFRGIYAIKNHQHG